MINYQSSGKRTAANLAAGKLKIDVLDPSLANGCVTPTLPGINWIPIKPATNSAFCAALIQKMIADKTFDAEAMSFTNQKAALAAGYAAFCNGSFLVIDDESHPNYKKLMRPADAGIDAPEKLDKDGKLNGDVIDGILSQEKKEVDKVIINSAELEKYFGKDKSPREMKDKIISLLDNWKAKQPPELGKPEKKTDLEK